MRKFAFLILFFIISFCLFGLLSNVEAVTPDCSSCTGTVSGCNNWTACYPVGSSCVKSHFCTCTVTGGRGVATATSNCSEFDYCPTSSCFAPTNPPNNNPVNPPQVPNPTATTAPGQPTPTGTQTTKLASTEGTEDLCQSLVTSKNIVNTGETFTLTATSKNNTDIQTFDFLFFNKDTGKAIKFAAGEYKKNITLTVFRNTYTTDAINFTDFLFPDLNWPNYYANWPKNIIVEAYLHQSATKWSKFDPACRVELKINSVQPTPTPNPGCVCASGSCTAAPTCLFDKYDTGFTYNTPIKCNLDNSLFYSTPTDTNKTGWCQSYLRQKGDANGDGKVDALDYFYFVSVKSAGAKVPATVNVDFNGDGNITNDGDRAIIIKTLKQL